jgi:RNA polymerase sigma-70 factor (family 1)
MSMLNKESSDLDVTKALWDGDEEALTLIFQRYWKKLYYLALRKTGSHDTAEEIVQDLFADIWDKRSTLFHRRLEGFSLSAYLTTAVKHKVLNLIRSQIYTKSYFDYYKTAFAKDEKSTEHQVEYDQLTDALEEGIQKLPEKSKQVFKLNRLEGRTVQEIAHLLNLSEKAIEYHLTKSLKTIRVHLKDYILSFLLFFQICS